MKKIALPALLCLILTNCASITTGQNQSLSVNTEPAQGATCTLTNDKGTWYASNTPSSVTVHRSYNDLNVTCKKDGFNSANISVKSNTKGMAYGNILAGGIIGGAIDAGTGAAYDYPSPINVKMTATKLSSK